MKSKHEADVMIFEFLKDRAAALSVILNPEVDLLDTRVIDSLAFMNFIMLLEEILDRPIELDQIEIDDLRTLRAIENRFLKSLPEAA